MVILTPSIQLSSTQMEALKFIAIEEGKNVDETIGWIIVESIPSILDVMNDGDGGRRDELARALIDEQD